MVLYRLNFYVPITFFIDKTIMIKVDKFRHEIKTKAIIVLYDKKF